MESKNKQLDLSENENSGHGSSIQLKWIRDFIGTFGLAVLLVVWYLVKMQPAELAKYESLRDSIDKLNSELSTSINNLDSEIQLLKENLLISVDEVTEIVRTDHTFLTRHQANNLKKLYIATVTSELDTVISNKLRGYGASVERNKKLDDLADEIKKVMTEKAEMLADLIQVPHSDIQSYIAKQIHGKEGVSESIANEAIDKWENLEPEQVGDKLEYLLQMSFSVLPVQ